jgi:hypothetical protein
MDIFHAPGPKGLFALNASKSIWAGTIDSEARHDGSYAGKVCTGRAADLVLGARAELLAWPGPVGDDSGGLAIVYALDVCNFLLQFCSITGGGMNVKENFEGGHRHLNRIHCQFV